MIETKHIAKALISLVEDDKKDAEYVASDFEAFMRKYGLESRIGSVIFHLEAEAKRKAERERVSVTLARETSDELVEKIKKTVGAKKGADVQIEYDEGLVSGFRAHYKDKLYEANLSSILEELKKNLSS